MIPEMPLHRIERSAADPWPADGAPRTDAGPVAPARAAREPAHDGESMQLPPDRMIGLRFIKAALGRTRRLWIGTAVVGLAIGGLFHVVVPLKYWATSTVYLVHGSSSPATVGAQDDLAMLQTNAVATRALARLHDPGLTPGGLLGKDPGTLLSQNVLEISVSGPTSSAAVRRVDALTAAYLSFRAQEYGEQNRALVAATTAQEVKLQSVVKTLSAKITSGTSSSGQLTVLEAQRTADLSQITGLAAAIQQDDLNQVAVTSGSKVLAPGASVPASKKKVFVLDGLTGLVAGLGLGLVVVLAVAMLTDRVRRREDVADVLGTPVALSVGHIGGHRPGADRPALLARDPKIRAVVHHLRQQLRQQPRRDGTPPSALVVPVGCTRDATAALLALSFELAGEGVEVTLVDATGTGSLRRAAGRAMRRRRSARRSNLPSPTVIAASLPQDGAGSASPTASVTPGSTVLVLATVDPSVGAGHLRSWGRQAVVMISAGRARVQQLAATAELLDAAGVVIESAVLLDAEPSDDSVGLPTRAPSDARRRPGARRDPRPTVT